MLVECVVALWPFESLQAEQILECLYSRCPRVPFGSALLWTHSLIAHQVPVATSHRAKCWPDFFTPNTETSMDTFADKPIPISCTVNAVGSCLKAASHPFTRANPRSDICSCCNFSSKGYIKFLQQLMTFNIGTLRAWEQNGEEKRKVGVQVPRGFITIWIKLYFIFSYFVSITWLSKVLGICGHKCPRQKQL